MNKYFLSSNVEELPIYMEAFSVQETDDLVEEIQVIVSGDGEVERMEVIGGRVEEEEVIGVRAEEQEEEDATEQHFHESGIKQ